MGEQQMCKEGVEKKRREWAEHIRSCGESGKSDAQYCREQGLSPKAFCYWKRKYRKRPEATIRLVPVGRQMIPVGQARSQASPLVLMAGRYRVEIGTGFDSATLVQLVRTLEGI